MKKILILGAGGFVGSYIVPLLAKNYEVIPVYKNEIMNECILSYLINRQDVL